MTIDWPAVHRTRRRITKLEAELKDLYAARRDLFAAMAATGMGQREIGAYWGVSNPVVSYALNGGKAAIRRRRDH